MLQCMTVFIVFTVDAKRTYLVIESLPQPVSAALLLPQDGML